MDTKKIRRFCWYLMAFVVGYILTNAYVRADEIVMKAGLGTNSLMPTSTIKNVSLSYRKSLGNVVYATGFGGSFYAEGFTYYGGLGLGMRVIPFKFFRFDAMVGPGMISRTDRNLGGKFQIFLQGGPSFVDPETGALIGIQFEHISSAGLYKNNLGRDFWMFLLGVRL